MELFGHQWFYICHAREWLMTAPLHLECEGLAPGFHMMRKSIQNGLPAIALLFDRVSWLSVKCLSHGDPAGGQ